MAIRTMEQLIEQLKKYDPKQSVFYVYYTKEDILDDVMNRDLVDENDNLLTDSQIEALVSDEFVENVLNSVYNSDYLWEKFSEEMNDSIYHAVEESTKSKEEIIEDTELWNA